MNPFEQALREKAEGDESGARILWAQWEFDQRLLSDALSLIPASFGHYSRHDASHSNTILMQIAHILGPKRIAKLSATDLWLLLEAAHTHDIGMLMSDAESREMWRSTAFQQHLRELQRHADPEYRTAAEKLSDPRGCDPRALGPDWPFEIGRWLTLALGDFKRRDHAANSMRIIENPERIGLRSPRGTHLFPHRLITMLGRICLAHGQTFEDAMALPKTTQGAGGDNAHPRFIACMLRIGDLLDLDNGRFCPVMTACFGPLPASSAVHEKKHASIQQFLVTPQKIEVIAETDDYAVCAETDRWFSWLKEELGHLAVRWAKIAPSRDFGTSPSPGRIEARIVGQPSIQSLPRDFSIDKDAFFKLIRGTNLYASPLDAIRELVQNATDATILRAWREHEERIMEIDAQSKIAASCINPISESKRLLRAYPIHTDILVSSDPQAPQIRVSIHDMGIGMMEEDIKYLLNVGSSGKNNKKTSTYYDIPEWLRPSGCFGIGFQSIFMIADHVEITTRSIDSGQAIKIIIDEPTNNIQLLYHNEKIDPGTKIIFNTRKFFQNTLIAVKKHKLFQELFQFSTIENMILEKFQEITMMSMVPVTFRNQLVNSIKIDSHHYSNNYYELNQQLSESIIDKNMRYYMNNFEFDFNFHVYNRTSQIYYRGSLVCDAHFGSEHLTTNINICNYLANDLLTASRNQLTTYGHSFLHNNILPSIHHIVKQEALNILSKNMSDNSENDLGTVLGAALWVIHHCKDHHLLDLAQRCQTLREYSISHSHLPLKHFLDRDNFKISISKQNFNNSNFYITENNTFHFHNHQHLKEYFSIFRALKWNVTLNITAQCDEYIFCKTKKYDTFFNMSIFMKTILHYSNNYSQLPCLQIFNKLQVQESFIITDYESFLGVLGLRLFEVNLISPFINIGTKIHVDKLDTLIEYVHLHSIHSVSMQEIAQEYYDFIQFVDDTMLHYSKTSHPEFKEQWLDKRGYTLDQAQRLLEEAFDFKLKTGPLADRKTLPYLHDASDDATAVAIPEEIV